MSRTPLSDNEADRLVFEGKTFADVFTANGIAFDVDSNGRIVICIGEFDEGTTLIDKADGAATFDADTALDFAAQLIAVARALKVLDPIPAVAPPAEKA